MHTGPLHLAVTCNHHFYTHIGLACQVSQGQLRAGMQLAAFTYTAHRAGLQYSGLLLSSLYTYISGVRRIHVYAHAWPIGHAPSFSVHNTFIVIACCTTRVQIIIADSLHKILDPPLAPAVESPAYKSHEIYLQHYVIVGCKWPCFVTRQPGDKDRSIRGA